MNLCQRLWILILDRSLNKNLSSKYGQKLLDITNNFATNIFKTVSKRASQNTAESTDDPVETKIAEKITKDPSKSTPADPKKSMTVLTPQPTSISNEIYIPPEKQQQAIDELLLLQLSL